MANNDNIIYARFNHGHEITTDPRSQYAYGQVVKISGLHLPASFDADIANKGDKQAKAVIGTNNELPIDDNYFLSGKDIIIMINVHATDKDGRTKYIINIPIDKRSKRADIELEPVEQDIVSTAIATLNEAVERTSADVESAENSASRAHESAISAEQSATNASNSEELAQQYMERAETAAESSEKSETKAKASEESAKQSETHAEQIANDIEQYTERAETASRNAEASATIATEKAGEISESAEITATKANEASNAATHAHQAATYAGEAANSASASADNAELNAQKTQSDKEAVESAKSDVLSAVDNAQNYADSAQSASQAIQNMNVEATTLEPDSDATVEKTVDAISGAVTLTYGIPKGQVGEKGDKGDTGGSGVYIGTSAPSDENIKVWIDTDEEGSDIYEPINELKKDVESLNEKISILANRGSSWEEIRQNVKMGYGETLYPVGTDLEVECTENSPYTSIVFTVVDHSVIDNEPCMTLLMKSGINGLQFEHEQALIVPTETLVAGTYHFNFPDNYDASHDGTKTVQFTLVNDVQANDQIMIQYPNNQSWIGKNLTVYSNFTDTVLETCVMSEGEDGTDLGVADGSGIINHITRARYGANNWKESAMRQWLNTDALVNKWQTQQNRYQRPCTYLTKQNGFMSWFNSDFVGVIKETNHLNRTNRVYDSLGVKTPYSTNDKFFLLSQEEVGFNSEDDIICGTCFDYYVDAENIDRIKYDINNSATAKWWWLRTPNPSNAINEHYVYSYGSLSGSGGCYGSAVVSACTI